MDKVRVDKWLWSVRVFKSRTLATDACKSGKVKLGGHSLKPSYLIQRGDQLEVKKNGFDLQFKVIDLIQKRVSAPLAQVCYEDLTPAEEMNKYQNWFVGKSASEKREKERVAPPRKKEG